MKINKTLLMIMVLCFISRIPFLISDDLLLDGDECIVGLMSKHFLQGEEFPLFFYGQTYGFSFIEVLFISFSYLLLGITDIAVKLAMLLLWTIGVVFIYLIFKKIFTGKHLFLPFILTLAFIFHSSWFIWSMEARGGYLTSFTSVSVLLYFLFYFHEKINYLISFVVGVLLGVIFYAQPLWLPGLIPVLIYFLFRTSIRNTVTSIIGVLFIVSLFEISLHNVLSCWNPSVFSFSNISWENILKIPYSIYQSASGNYYYNRYLPPIALVSITSLIYSFLIIIVSIFGVVHFIRYRKFTLYHAFVCSVVLTLAYLPFTDMLNPRYLLPLFGYSFFMFALFPLEKIKEKVITYLMPLLIVFGVISTLYVEQIRDFYSKSDLIELTNELEAKNIHFVYSRAGLLQWQITFYSNERVISRYTRANDRYPKYIDFVNHAWAQEKGTAIIDYSNRDFEGNPNTKYITDKFSLLYNPTKEELQKMGFEVP